MNRQTKIGLAVAAVFLVGCLGISLCGMVGMGVYTYWAWNEDPAIEDVPDVNGAVAPNGASSALPWLPSIASYSTVLKNG